tara:strand:+ start:4980 stop:6098 length:1119 start_codon:yes stop_codon:yes gene_type:complete
MNPVIANLVEDNDTLRFTLSGVNVSLANALRRIMLSDILCVVFRTTPYIQNKMDILSNTTRLNNELIKQRMSCVPIHISDTSFPIDNYEIQIYKKNETDVIEYVTTEDIKIKDLQSDKYLSSEAVKVIFPPDKITGDYIDIARLRPKLSEDIDGEELSLTSRLDIGSAKEDGAFNVVCTASYGYTKDTVKINDYLTKMDNDLKANGVPQETIDFKKKDWLLLGAETLSVPDSFDFIVESVGQFTNMDICHRAADVMLTKLSKFEQAIKTNPTLIADSETTLENGFDVKLIGEDYTLGKAIEYVLYEKYYKKGIINFCGFKKPHPHIDESIIRVGFKDKTSKADLVGMLSASILALTSVFQQINDFFKPSTEE